MSDPKTKPRPDACVDTFLNEVEPPRLQQACRSVHEMMRSISGTDGVLWGTSIVGFGTYHYVYASKREGDWMRIGYAPRKAGLAVYLMCGIGDRQKELLQRLGKHKMGVSCMTIPNLDQVDMSVLRQLIEQTWVCMEKKYPQGGEEKTKQRKRKVEQLHEIPPSNDKWSFISSTAKIDEVHSIPMSVLEQRTTSRQELDLQEYSKEELQELKKNDPFMYYSIPGVRSAKLALKDVDLSDVSALCQGGTNAKSSSRPSERSKGSSNNTIVVRRSALSLECHSDLFLADVFDDLSICGDDDEFSLFDDLDVLLRAK